MGFLDMASVAKFLTLVIIIMAASWGGLWWYAEGRLQTGVTGWIANTAAANHAQITYDSVTRSSSPMVASVTLTNLRFATPPGSPVPITVTLPSFSLEIDAANPLLLLVKLPPQINFTGARGDASVTFGGTQVQYQIDPQAIFSPAVSPLRNEVANAQNINILASGGSLQVLHIDSYQQQGSVHDGAAAGQSAATTTAALQGIALSPLLTKLGGLPFNGQIKQIGIAVNINGPIPGGWKGLVSSLNSVPASDPETRRKLVIHAMHDWAAQGGSAAGSFSFTVGPSTFNADANVGFDPNVQPVGTAYVTANHLDALSAGITAAYPQAQAAINAGEAHLSPYLSTDNANGQVLSLHVTYGSGTVSINGDKVGVLPAINWVTLETTPPVAPGDGSGAAAPPAN
jgi:hypothetical protein